MEEKDHIMKIQPVTIIEVNNKMIYKCQYNGSEYHNIQYRRYRNVMHNQRLYNILHEFPEKEASLSTDF